MVATANRTDFVLENGQLAYCQEHVLYFNLMMQYASDESALVNVYVPLGLLAFNESLLSFAKRLAPDGPLHVHALRALLFSGAIRAAR